MKKHPLLMIVLLLLLVALLPLTSGCTATTNQVSATVLSTGTDGYSDAAKAADEALAAITQSADIAVPTGLITPGTLTIAGDQAYPPLEFLAKVVTQEGENTADTTALVGFEVDLMTAVAKKLGLTPSFVQVSFTNLPAVLADGEVADIAASGLATSQELLSQFLASDIYLPGDLAICTASGAAFPDEASLQGKIVGAQTGSAAEAVAKSIPGIAEVRLFPHVAGAFADLKDGNIQALIVAKPVAEWIVQTGDYAGVVVVSGAIPTEQGYAFWCNKDDQALLDAVNAALAELMQAPEPAQQATTTTVATADGAGATETSTTTGAEVTTTTETALAASASVYELLLQKWGLSAE